MSKIPISQISPKHTQRVVDFLHPSNQLINNDSLLKVFRKEIRQTITERSKASQFTDLEKIVASPKLIAKSTNTSPFNLNHSANKSTNALISKAQISAIASTSELSGNPSTSDYLNMSLKKIIDLRENSLDGSRKSIISTSRHKSRLIEESPTYHLDMNFPKVSRSTSITSNSISKIPSSNILNISRPEAKSFQEPLSSIIMNKRSSTPIQYCDLFKQLDMEKERNSSPNRVSEFTITSHYKDNNNNNTKTLFASRNNQDDIQSFLRSTNKEVDNRQNESNTQTPNKSKNSILPNKLLNYGAQSRSGSKDQQTDKRLSLEKSTLIKEKSSKSSDLAEFFPSENLEQIIKCLDEFNPNDLKDFPTTYVSNMLKISSIIQNKFTITKSQNSSQRINPKKKNNQSHVI